MLFTQQFKIIIRNLDNFIQKETNIDVIDILNKGNRF